MYPLFLKMTGRLALVVGGGDVGRRKAASLLRAGGRVRLVCLEPRPPEEMASDLDWLTEAYRPGHLDGATLVFAAATAEVNGAVVHDAHVRGVWVNSATAPEIGDFFTAAAIHCGDLTLALSTGGLVPALTRALRQRLENEFDDTFATWVTLLAVFRTTIRERVPDARRRQRLWEWLCDESWLPRLRTDGVERVRRAMAEGVSALADDSAPPL